MCLLSMRFSRNNNDDAHHDGHVRYERHYLTRRMQVCGVHLNGYSGAYDSSRCENVQIIILMSTSALMNWYDVTKDHIW